MPAQLVQEIATGTLADVLVAAGRHISRAALRERHRSEVSAEVRWFDTYRLTEKFPDLPDVPSPEVLRGDEAQALIHELLAVRLTDAPEGDAARVRSAYALTLEPAGISSDTADALFDYYDLEICGLVGRLEDTTLLRQVRNEALFARIIAILHAIERHTAALEARPDRQTEEGWLTRYRRHLVEHHGLIDPPDFDRRRRVPIAKLYVPPTLRPFTSIRPDRTPAGIDLWTLDEEIDRTVLLGDPGAGKTTAANVLMHHHGSDPELRVPFLVTLREYAGQEAPGWSMAAFVEHKLETFYQCPTPPGLVMRLLLSGRALVIFDGLDELVDSARRTHVASMIERFCTEYPLTRVLVTSRLVGYDQARLDDRQFTCYRIDRFSDDPIAEYVRKWFVQEPEIAPDEAEQWAAAFLEESAAVPDLRTNPLMLSLMCILYRGEGSLPRDRAEVYERCAKLLYQQWDARRRIHLDLRAGRLLDPVLRHLAHWLLTRDSPEPAVTERELVEETGAVLHDHGFESATDAREAAEEFVAFCRGRMWVFSSVSNTTTAGQPLYAFTHRTFMEYFAAAHLAYTSDTPEDLARVLTPHAARNEWEVVGELAIQIKNATSRFGADRIYAALLADRLHPVEARSRILQFLGRCLRSVSPIPATIRALTTSVLDHALAGDLDDKARYLPLFQLIESCRDPEVVAEVISTRITEMIGAGSNPPIRHKALRFAIALPRVARGAQSGHGLTQDDPVVRFWLDHTRQLVQTYTAEILAATDHAIPAAAFGTGYLTLHQLLTGPDGLLVLLRGGTFTMFENTWGYPGVLERHPDPMVFRAIGEYLISNPEPPFAPSPPQPWSSTTEMASIATTATTDPITYLGTAACLLISSEATPADRRISQSKLGLLAPYTARRWKIGAADSLPELPIPERFQRLFREWADNKTDLLGPPQDS